MKLILNKNNININNINLLEKKIGYKILYKLNNAWMNGIHIRINDYKIYKNDEFLYITLCDEDNKLLNNIINYINNKLDINIKLKNNTLKILNNEYDDKGYLNLNISNVKLLNNKYMLYIYD
jgi:hypothetical protein